MAGSIKDKEAFQRLNYLYQVSKLSKVFRLSFMESLKKKLHKYNYFLGCALCIGPKSGEHWTGPVLLFHPEDHSQTPGAETVSTRSYYF